MKKGLVIMLMPLVAGCGVYTAAQRDLAQQARKGAAMWEAREKQRQAEVALGLAARRGQLDAAFDADVRGRPALDGDWVIEHRKAYGIALAALGREEAAALAAGEVAAANARAVDAALERLIWLIDQQAKLEWWPVK